MEPDLRLLELQARMCQALSSPKRLHILYALKEGELTAGDLARVVDATTPNLSQHLTVMRQQGLVEARKDGSNIYYRLAMPEILDACSTVRGLLVKRLESLQVLLGSAREG